MASKKILIAEDEKPLANALSLKLKSSGFDSTVVHNGDDALSLIKKTAFDLVLMDIMMPKMNGFAVLEEMKKEGISVPVFVMSNLSQDEDIKHVQTLGVKDYIVKSDTPLAEIVEKIVSYFNAKK